MCAKHKDGRDPDSGNTARGDDTPPDKDSAKPDLDNTVETNTSGKSDPELMRGKVLDSKYEIISHLGSGAMGAVYKARHKVLNKEVAIKILQTANLDDSVKKKRFMREARAQGGLTHKNIAAVHDVGLTENDQPYFVMDLLNGESLEEHLEQHKSLDCREFISIFEQVARGIQHAHSKSIVHRDIKPSNIMLIETEDGDLQALVVDFGIAVMGESDTTKLTKEGYIVGTPHYMSPEQIVGKELDARSDVYSLGCVMYEALTGSPPFHGINASATMAMHIAQKPEDLSTLSTKSPLPPGLADLVMRCIEKEPEKRYSTAKEISAQLNSIKTSSMSNTASAASAAENQKSTAKVEGEEDLVGAGKGHQSKNPAHAPAILEAQSDSQKNNVTPQENKSANLKVDEKSAEKIELKEVKPSDQPKGKTGGKTGDSADSLDQSSVSLEFDKSTDTGINIALESERVQAHLPTDSNTISPGVTALPPISSEDDGPLIQGHDIIRITTGVVLAVFFWPTGGRLVLPISAAEMRDDNLFFIVAKFLVDAYNHLAIDKAWQYLIPIAIVLLVDRVVRKLLNSGPDD